MLVVQVPSIFFAKWLRDHYLEVISQCAREVLSDFEDIKFIPSSELEGLPTSSSVNGAVFQHEVANAQRKVRTATKYRAFNHRYTFERFVIGAGNRFAHAAAKAVVQSLGRAYNPLFLYGGTGLGKTHLMQAIGREALERDPSANVVFISSEQFTNQLIESIAKKSTKRFRTKYRKADVLLISAIHFIAGKDAK
ncbi:MAG: ATP-binding protein, partial [Candidatus Hydrogenedentes bacterium]|nr:ATP-binding protein [Candidatus Hydrogenedentota bacterium]